jgi:hypothetical protein
MLQLFLSIVLSRMRAMGVVLLQHGKPIWQAMYSTG